MTTRPAVTPALSEEYCEKFRNWGRWGPDDEIGTLNFITPEVITRAAGLVKQSKVVSCALNFDTDGPQTGAFGPGKSDPQHGGHRHRPCGGPPTPGGSGLRVHVRGAAVAHHTSGGLAHQPPGDQVTTVGADLTATGARGWNRTVRIMPRFV
jgi:hypothetical protein